MKNKYVQQLIDNCTYLDVFLKTNQTTLYASQIIEHNEDVTRKLLLLINDASRHKDPQLTQIAIATKDSLINYLGYTKLSDIISDDKENEDEYTFDELMSQLDQLIGLKDVKAKVSDLIAFQKVQLLRKDHGLHSPQSTMHLAFTGNPGTGKTTVARIVGRIYKKLGLLSKGHFMEVSRTDLIAGYQGQTAHKVKTIIEKAKGGVLFIDEAYSITENDHSDSYGRECLTELTKALEDYRKDLVVIVAGYTEPMKQFFISNPGLKSRFNTFIEFDDYNANELLDILCQMIYSNDYLLTETTKLTLEKYITTIKDKEENDFANGRFARNIFETMIMNQARRVSAIQIPTLNDLKELTEDDIPTDL